MMLRAFQVFIVASFLFVSIALVWFTIDPLGTQKKERDALRAEHLSAIMDSITAYASRPKAGLPGIGLELTQIGSAETGCALTTPFCSIKTDSCLNLHNTLTGDPRLISLPSDILYGSVDKTGYAVRYIKENGNVELVACYGESGTAVSLKKSFMELLYGKTAAKSKTTR